MASALQGSFLNRPASDDRCVTAAVRLTSMPAPAEELARMRALARYAIVGTPNDPAFDDLAELARVVSGSPMAGIGFFEGERVWFKSLAGGEPEPCSVSQLLRPRAAQPRRQSRPRGSFGEALDRGAVFSVPCVTPDGFTLGCVFVAGIAPEKVNAQQIQAMTSLARQLLRLLELRRTLLSYHTVVDGAGQVVFQLDQTGCLVSLTPTWSRLSGYGVVRSIGSQLQDFLHADDRGAFEMWLDQVERAAVPLVTQCRLLTLAGHEVPVEVLARSLVDEGERKWGVVGVVADVTERHAREIETQHLQKLEALGRLSAGLAHEINTPIQFVGDNARFLADSYESMLKLVDAYRVVLSASEDTASWADRHQTLRQAEVEADLAYLAAEVPVAIQQSLDGVERVASLVRAMKTFSHPGSGEQAAADLNEAIRATLTVARNQFRYIAQAELELGELPPVTCNIADLNQVFLNLVINAADAIEEKGEHGTIEIKSWQEDDHAVVAISDSGSGVPDDIRQRIFEPFFTTKPVGQGTGQGLALARAVIDRHSGVISLDSKRGVGTTFTIRLPINGRVIDTEVSS